MPFWNWGRGIGCVSTVSILIPKLHNTSVKGRKLTEFSGIRCRQCSSCKWPALQTLTQSQTELSSPSDPLVDSIAYIMSVRTFWIQVSTILANKRPHPFFATSLPEFESLPVGWIRSQAPSPGFPRTGRPLDAWRSYRPDVRPLRIGFCKLCQANSLFGC